MAAAILGMAPLRLTYLKKSGLILQVLVLKMEVILKMSGTTRD